MTPVEDALTLVLNAAGEAASACRTGRRPSLSEVGPTTLLGRRLAEDVVALDHHPPFPRLYHGWIRRHRCRRRDMQLFSLLQQAAGGTTMHVMVEGRSLNCCRLGMCLTLRWCPCASWSRRSGSRGGHRRAPHQWEGKWERPVNSSSRSSKSKRWVSIKTSVPKGKWIRKLVVM